MAENDDVKRVFKRLPIGIDGKLLENNFGLKSPRNLVVVKYPKSGSTLSLCDVDKVLIADSEKGTTYFNPKNMTQLLDESVAELFVSTKKYGWLPQTLFDLVDELKYANKMDNYWELMNSMDNERDDKKKGETYMKVLKAINSMPFPILAIDTITSLVAISNSAALYEYNKNVAKPKNNIKTVDEYGGVQYIRRKFNEIKMFIEQNAAPFIQYHGHVATRKKVMKKDDEDINALDIALDGVLSTIFTAKADAVATFYRNDEGCFLDFLKKDETDLGSRPLHLSNKKIKIAELLKDGDLEKGIRPKTFWNTIYPELNMA